MQPQLICAFIGCNLKLDKIKEVKFEGNAIGKVISYDSETGLIITEVN